MLFKWIEATQLKCISSSTIICGEHFKSSDYINLNAKKRRLKKDIVPSLNLFPQEKDEHIFHEDEETDSAEDDFYIDSEKQCSGDSEHITGNSDNNSIEELEKLKVEGFVANSLIEHLKDEIEVIESASEHSKCNKEIQTDTSSVDVTPRIFVLHKSIQTTKFSLLNLLKTDSDLQAFARISFSTLEALTKAMCLTEKKVSDKHLCSLNERIILTLCKLKLCLSFNCLSILFGISKSTACNYFAETLQLLVSVLEKTIYIFQIKKKSKQIFQYILKIFKIHEWC